MHTIKRYQITGENGRPFAGFAILFANRYYLPRFNGILDPKAGIFPAGSWSGLHEP
jgi:hypothetical protein